MDLDDLLIKYPNPSPRNYADRHREQYLTRQYLEEYLFEIRSLFYGSDISIKKMISDKNGKVIDSKLEEMVSKIVDGYFDALWETRLYWAEKGHKHMDISEEAKNSLDRQAEMYRCFFYCALQGICVSEYRFFRPVETFGDLKELISSSFERKNNMISTKRALFYGDIYSEYDQNFTTFLETARLGCYLLTKTPISNTYNKEEKEFSEQIIRETEQQIALFKQSIPREYIIEETSDTSCAEEADKAPKFDNVQPWIDSVADPDKFVKAYVRYRQLYTPYLEKQRIPLARDVLAMVDHFLDREGLTYFSSAEETALAFKRIESIIYTLKKRR